jgi:hypothetical protein
MVSIGVRFFFFGRFTSLTAFIYTYLPFAVVMTLYYLLKML